MPSAGEERHKPARTSRGRRRLVEAGPGEAEHARGGEEDEAKDAGDVELIPPWTERKWTSQAPSMSGAENIAMKSRPADRPPGCGPRREEAAALQLHLGACGRSRMHRERRDAGDRGDDEADPPVNAASARMLPAPRPKAIPPESRRRKGRRPECRRRAPEDGADRRDRRRGRARRQAAERRGPEPRRDREDQAADADEDAAEPQAAGRLRSARRASGRRRPGDHVPR